LFAIFGGGRARYNEIIIRGSCILFLSQGTDSGMVLSEKFNITERGEGERWRL
jgi:hypothetical protein